MICHAGRIRVLKGLRRIDVASAAGVTLGTVARIERGDVVAMKVETVIRVARALGVPATDLIPALGARLGAQSSRIPKPKRACAPELEA